MCMQCWKGIMCPCCSLSLPQVAHYKTLHKTTVPEMVTKTSCPQSFHIPSKVDGIKPRPVNEVSFVKLNPKK
ncbi:hypothetical protein DPMN_083726 [Dreissena polymorpha]|uniref:Uncharacterized protein n=1 Tax=Dreissena polymorpha TaxID=45954 RepID=A0A9D4BBD7_DREPO|nr:hypothetical protein DPMN_083726 [Dreissena polymorpha]